MVSMNHELPLPVQAPPGHYVQQIVDENGVVTHFILSQHPGPAAGYLPPSYTNGSSVAAGPGPALTPCLKTRNKQKKLTNVKQKLICPFK